MSTQVSPLAFPSSDALSIMLKALNEGWIVLRKGNCFDIMKKEDLVYQVNREMLYKSADEGTETPEIGTGASSLRQNLVVVATNEVVQGETDITHQPEAAVNQNESTSNGQYIQGQLEQSAQYSNQLDPQAPDIYSTVEHLTETGAQISSQTNSNPNTRTVINYFTTSKDIKLFF